MLVPAWALLAAVTIGVIVVAALCLVIRRAMTELFFWRGAYKCTNDRAYELFREIGRVPPPSGGDSITGTDLREGSRAAARLPAEAPGNSDKSFVQKYHESVHLVEESAARLNIDWVTDADREFWLSEYQASPFRFNPRWNERELQS